MFLSAFQHVAILGFEKNEVIFLITLDLKSKSSDNPYFLFLKENQQLTHKTLHFSKDFLKLPDVFPARPCC